MGLFDFDFGGLGTAIGSVARRSKFASWKGARSPYGLPIPIAYGVTWVTPIQVYSGEQFTYYAGDPSGAMTMRTNYYGVDDVTGEISIDPDSATAAQSAVLVLCEKAYDILDITKDGVSINQATGATTVEQRLAAISARTPVGGVIPPAGEAAAYFHGGFGAATAHTRFSRTANLGAAPYTYSNVAHVAFCALAIGGAGSRPRLRFLVRGLLATGPE